MNLKSRSIYLLIFYLFYEIILILISSINIKFVLISIVINLIVLIKEKSSNELKLIHYYSSLIYSLIHYIIFTLSYAEILPWETIIVIFLFILIIYYNKKLTDKSYSNCILFDKCKEDIDSNINILMIKCQLANICYYFYTFHLCLTTICTPEMYFNWLLIVKNCRFTYSNLHSSYTFSGGIIISLFWAFIYIYYFIKNLFR